MRAVGHLICCYATSPLNDKFGIGIFFTSIPYIWSNGIIMDAERMPSTPPKQKTSFSIKIYVECIIHIPHSLFLLYAVFHDVQV